MTRLPGVRLLRAAKLLLNARDVERFVEPAIAELQHECRRDHAAWAARWAPLIRIVGMLVYLWEERASGERPASAGTHSCRRSWPCFSASSS